MKHLLKAVLCTLFCLLTFHVNSQEISFSKLLKLSENYVDSIEEYISDKRWKYLRIEKESGGYDKLHYAFEPNQYDGRKASAFFTIYYTVNYSDRRILGQIEYQYSSDAYYDKVMKSIKTLGFKLEKIEHTSNYVSKIYSNDKYQLTVSSASGHSHESMQYVYVINAYEFRF